MLTWVPSGTSLFSCLWILVLFLLQLFTPATYMKQLCLNNCLCRERFFWGEAEGGAYCYLPLGNVILTHLDYPVINVLLYFFFNWSAAVHLFRNLEEDGGGDRKEKGKAGIFVKGDHAVLIIGFEGSRPLSAHQNLHKSRLHFLERRRCWAPCASGCLTGDP